MRPYFRTVLAALLCASGVPVFAQVRDFVCTVSPVYPETTLAYATKTADSLEKSGYGDAAKILREFSKGGFGSGFAYVTKTGDNYIVTNRHVVVDAATADVEFETTGGEAKKYAACPIIAVDDELDLAILAFPNGQKPFAKGLAFASSALEDGQEVWSAGYPGLGGKPAWQFGKGSVTNAAARIDELVDSKISALIQHSAQVDPGNSGGPLLVAAKDAPGGYAVVGVNTWKARFRQAANFALPGATVAAFIDRATAEASDEVKKQRLDARFRAFVAATAVEKDRYRKFGRFVAYSWVEQRGEAAFKTALASAPTDIRSDITSTFVDAPFEGMRLAIAFELDQKLAKSKETLRAKEEPVAVTSPTGKTVAEAGSEQLAIEWKEEYRSWRIQLFPEMGAPLQPVDKKKKKGVASVSFESPYTFVLAADLSFVGDDLRFFSVDAVGMLSDFTAVGVTAGVAKAERDTYIDSYGDTVGDDSGNLVRIGGVGRLQLPIAMDTFAVIPYVEASLGMQIDEVDAYGNGLYGRVSGGLQASLDVGAKLVLGLAYGKDAMAVKTMDYESDAETEASAFSIWFGVAF